MELILIRHLPTAGNLERRYIGRTDEPLTEQNEVLDSYPPAEVVISSPLRRCIQTAKLIYPGQQPIICEAFQECDFGVFEGKNYEQLKTNKQYIEWLDSGGTIIFPGGEHPAAFKKRCVQGFREMMTMFLARECDAAAMVIHGGTIMAILEQFDPESRDFYQWQVDNGGGYLVRLDQNEWHEGRQKFTEIVKL